MIHLPNNCRCSDLSVFPKNWDKQNASTKKTWYIFYRFYDPNFPKPKAVEVKGMNEFKDLEDRQEATRLIIKNHEWALIHEGYNPITGVCTPPPVLIESEYEIPPQTPFIKALELARKKLTLTHQTLVDIDSVIKGTKAAAEALKYDQLSISIISRKHIKGILAKCFELNKRFSNARHNRYIEYLSMLFNELLDYEATENHPLYKMKKKPVVQKIRETLTDDQRKKVDKYLKANYYAFWRFMQIFFHSGGRERELTKLKASAVDLSNMRYKVTIEKGATRREVWKTIKYIALPYWQEMMSLVPKDGQDYYLFGEGLIPTLKQIRSDQIGRRWKVHVKNKLGITADFYSLKHLNSSEVVDQLGEQDAAALMSHTDTTMLAKVYDIKKGNRQHERLKKVNNTFS